MRILLTNDDGIDAPGIRTLERVALRLGADLDVVAPEHEHSAQSHAITIRQPLFVAERPPGEARSRFAVTGTPCDCVRLAVIKLLDRRPDLCLSGINHGANVGWNVFFSGTVSAAAEAHSFGIPSVALSLATFGPAEWPALEELTAELLRRLLAAPHPRADYLYNINLPDLAPDRIRGVRVTRQEPTVKGDNFVERRSPDGRRYFWPTWEEQPKGGADGPRPHDTYDSAAVRQGYISLTPLRYEVFDLDAPGLAGAFDGFRPAPTQAPPAAPSSP